MNRLAVLSRQLLGFGAATGLAYTSVNAFQQNQVAASSHNHEKCTVSCHCLNTTTGKPATNMGVRIEQMDRMENWQPLLNGKTNEDGRIPGKNWNLGENSKLEVGRYRAIFDTKSYFEASSVQDYWFPQVTVEFYVQPGQKHYHVPLLLSPYGYSTYRGS